MAEVIWHCSFGGCWHILLCLTLEVWKDFGIPPLCLKQLSSWVPWGCTEWLRQVSSCPQDSHQEALWSPGKVCMQKGPDSSVNHSATLLFSLVTLKCMHNGSDHTQWSTQTKEQPPGVKQWGHKQTPNWKQVPNGRTEPDRTQRDPSIKSIKQQV